MSIDLSNLSLAELKKLATNVEKAIATAESKKRQQALRAVEKVAKEYGVQIEELLSGDPSKPKRKKKAGPKPAKAKGKPKFRNPDNPSQTWSGKGRRPGWYIAAIDAGKTDADLAA